MADVKDIKETKPIFKRERKLANKDINKKAKVTPVKRVCKPKSAPIIKNENNINIKKDFPAAIKGIKVKEVKEANKKVGKKVAEKIAVKSLKILIV